MSLFLFWAFAALMLAFGMGIVLHRDPVSSAMCLVMSFVGLSALFFMLDAYFIGIIQILVYAGAIMVVFLFVVMLLNLGHPSEIADARGKAPVLVAAVIGIGLISGLMAMSRSGIAWQFAVPRGFNVEQMGKYGAVGTVARPLFNEYLLAFELTSVLLLVAIAGAVVLGRRKDGNAR